MHKNILTVVGITILFLGTCITPIVAIDNEKKASIPITDGNTLYVGGSGEGNYTKIQDAIDNASDGDTVYVYDDSSPYYENLTVNKSINLIGENKNTTIIDGQNKTRQDTVKIFSDNFTISGFTIRNCGTIYLDTSISIKSNNNTITNCIFYNNYIGIRLWRDYNDGAFSNNNIIKNNDFQEIKAICILIEGNKNKIFNNKFTKNNGGIEIEGKDNVILENIITHNEAGIVLDGNNNIITNNHITFNNHFGIWVINAGGNKIEKNNFILNLRQALFEKQFGARNTWDNNFWNRPRILPKVIFGVNVFYIKLIAVLFTIPFPAMEFDWHPAKEPYDI